MPFFLCNINRKIKLDRIINIRNFQFNKELYRYNIYPSTKECLLEFVYSLLLILPRNRCFDCFIFSSKLTVKNIVILLWTNWKSLILKTRKEKGNRNTQIYETFPYSSLIWILLLLLQVAWPALTTVPLT